MRVRLEYDRTGLEVELPAERVIRNLAYKDAAPLADPRAAVARVLAQTQRHATPGRAGPRTARRDDRHLRRHAAGPQRCDSSCARIRPTLEKAGIPRDKIRISYCHRAAPSEPRRRAGRDRRGKEDRRTLPLENHNGPEISTNTRSWAPTPRGVPAWIDTRDADLR